MSHEKFLSEIYSQLSTIISSDPLLSHFKCHPSKLNPSIEQKPMISISIRRFDHSSIDVRIPEDARLFQLKRSIREEFAEKKINWKYIWKRYALITDDQQQLIHDNRKLRDYGIFNNCQLSFARRRRLK